MPEPRILFLLSEDLMCSNLKGREGGVGLKLGSVLNLPSVMKGDDDDDDDGCLVGGVVGCFFSSE